MNYTPKLVGMDPLFHLNMEASVHHHHQQQPNHHQSHFGSPHSNSALLSNLPTTTATTVNSSSRMVGSQGGNVISYERMSFPVVHGLMNTINDQIPPIFIPKVELHDHALDLLSHHQQLHHNLSASPDNVGLMSPPLSDHHNNGQSQSPPNDGLMDSGGDLRSPGNAVGASVIATNGSIMATANGPQTFQCLTCFKVMKSLKAYKTHLRSHEKLHICNYCNKVFADSDTLKEHVDTHSLKDQVLKCPSCYKSFTDKEEHQQHTKEHNDLKEYRCLNCNKMFASSIYLKLHHKIHADEKPYKCSYCDKRFTFSSNLTVHTRIHTGHKPYRCAECNKCFTQINSLKQHYKIHSDEKPEKCLYCPKTFRYVGNLQSHMRTHTGEKPYHCGYCGKNFTQSGSLKIHLKQEKARLGIVD